MAPAFDPDAAAQFDGPYGLPFTVDDAKCVLVPVPFEATTSYGGGTKDGPQAIVAASRQVDLYDLEIGRVYAPGIAMVEESAEVRAWSDEAREAGQPVIDAGGIGEDPALKAAAETVNGVCERMNGWVYAQTRALLEAGKLPAIVGGDHSVPFGAIRAVAEKHPGVGVLHLDAHLDLRNAYEGFTWSHASIMFNVASRLPGVAKIVQVGIRDFGEKELDFARASNGRVEPHFDVAMARERLEGITFSAQVKRIVASLPREVYLSYDIDGLDPTLCPGTGTPVPGGLSFQEACYLTAEVARSGRRIVGLDLNEVSPGADGSEWNGNVGARLLYRMIGWMFVSQGLVAAAR
jgi:agmatinase